MSAFRYRRNDVFTAFLLMRCLAVEHERDEEKILNVRARVAAPSVVLVARSQSATARACTQTRFRQRHVAAKKLQAFWRGRYAGRLMAWLRERNQAALRIIVRASARACLAPARGARAR